MNHLSEQQLIDILLGLPRSASLDSHLQKCSTCRDNLAQLQDGMNAARLVEPSVAQLPVPPVTYAGYQRRQRRSRWIWMGAAAMFLMSILGLQVDISQDHFAVQFSLFSKKESAESEQIALLEQRLMEAIAVNSELTQSQLDARFNALFLERDSDIGSFQEALSDKLKGFELQNASYLASVREDLLEAQREEQVRGRLQ